MRSFHLGACLILGVCLSAVADNNGFLEDYVYVSHVAGGDTQGALYAVHRDTGDTIELQPSNTFWDTLTFSGVSDSDARLFVARGTGTDVLIAELAADGTTVNSANLSAIIGESPGTDLVVGNLRYSSYHNKLFLGVNPSKETVGAGNLAKAYEFGLDLTSADVNTYTGPTISKAYSSQTWGGGYSGPMVDIHPRTGTLYMSGINLGEEADTHDGDLIAFDTASGSTDTFAVLVDGATASYTTGWDYPVCPVYRGFIPDGRETMLVTQSASTSGAWRQQVELYLDATDANGNLAERVHPATPVDLTFAMQRRPFRAQLEASTGIIWAPSLNSGSSRSAGIWHFDPYDTRGKITGGDSWTQWNGFADADSPGAMPACRVSVWPALPQASLGPPGAAASPSSFDYTVSNTGASTDLNYSVAKVPDDATTAWLTLSKTAGTLAVGTSETVTASINSAGMSPGMYSVDLQFNDDCGTALEVRTIQLTLTECGMDVIPDAGVYLNGSCASEFGRTFTVVNSAVGGVDLNYTVEEVDANGDPQDHAWLTLDKTQNDAPLASGESDVVTAFITPGTGNDTTGYLKFTPSCAAQVPFASRFVTVKAGWTTQNYAYNGSVDPATPDSAAIGYTFGAYGTAFGQVVDDPDADNGKAWRMEKTGGESQSFFVFRANDDSSPYFEGRTGATIIARVKVVANLNLGSILGINRGGNTATDYVASQINWGGAGAPLGRIRDTWRHQNGWDATSADTGLRDQYVILRLTSGYGPFGEQTVAVYLNEHPEPVLLIPDAGPGTTVFAPDYGRDMGFGIGNAGGTGDVYFDWVVASNAGMFAPGEETDCLGMSLLPGACCLSNGTCELTNEETCAGLGGIFQGAGTKCTDGVCGPDPYADFDEDGDVDVADFAEFQRCMVSVGSGLEVQPGCERWDRNGDGFVDNTIVNSVSDLGAFLACSSGPGVPADVCCDGGIGCE